MTPRQLSVFIATFSYGGNGGFSAQNTTVGQYLESLILAIKSNPLVDKLFRKDWCDTPITMTRNAAILEARNVGADLLLMIDSDQYPDYEVGDWAEAKPFWGEAFPFIYTHYDEGPMVVGAPYCGPPPHERVHVFHWETDATDNPDDDFHIVPYSRTEAGEMVGIQPCAALPTGLILFDMRAFELSPPTGVTKENILQQLLDGKMSKREVMRALEPGWAYYEWKDTYAAEKASTEDVTLTRDISLMGILKLGYNPVHCAWSSWAGHWKAKLVGKPRLIPADAVALKMAEISHRLPSTERRIYANFVPNNRLPDGVQMIALPEKEPWMDPPAESDPRETPDHAWKKPRVQQRETTLVQLHQLLERMVAQQVPGDVVELGCHAGDTSLSLAQSLKQFDSDKELHVYDSFVGLPASTFVDSPDGVSCLPPGAFAATEEDVRQTFALAGFSPPHIHPGWFRDTLPRELPKQICFAFLDGDLYESIKLSLEAVWPRLSPGGVVVVHDYNNPVTPGVNRAVDEFYQVVGLTPAAAFYADDPEEPLIYFFKPHD